MIVNDRALYWLPTSKVECAKLSLDLSATELSPILHILKIKFVLFYLAVFKSF